MAWILAGILVLGGLVAVFNPLLTLIVLGIALTIFFLARNLEFGLLILVFFFPYLGLIIDFGDLEALREVPYLRDINAPFIDLYGVVLFVAWGLRRARHFMCRSSGAQGPALRRTLSEFPHLKSYFLFWLSGLISLFKVPTYVFGTAVKYFIRPFTFFYPVFFAMPVSIIQNLSADRQDSKCKTCLPTGRIQKVLTVFYGTGLLAAVDGLLGLIFGPHEAFPRATPWGFLGINPLGPNHNLLAETLIATAPVGLILSQSTRYTLHVTRYIRYGMFFQWAIALLTFARTAWIAVAVQAGIYIYWTHRGRVRAFLQRAFPVLLIVAFLLLLLMATTFHEVVRGSTLSRLDQARIAFFYFVRSPWIGQGVGTFMPTLWQTRAFLLEYGEPLEAHGVLFKLAFEQGLFGLAAFGVFAGAILRGIKKRGHVVALLIAAGSLTYQLFNTTYYTSKLWIPLAIAVAIARIYEHSHHHPEVVS